jgi:hypothetical protein
MGNILVVINKDKEIDPAARSSNTAFEKQMLWIYSGVKTAGFFFSVLFSLAMPM